MIKLCDNAIEVLNKRYLQKDKNGKVIETPEEMFRRVAGFVAQAEKGKDIKQWAERFYHVMSSLRFLPNSPCLRNAGANDGNLSACFVLPIEDSRQSIFKTLKEAVEVQAFGGGTGYNFSKLRPEGSLISSTKGKSGGPISFMNVFDFVIGEVIQQGGTRKGAQMGVLNIDHPDIEKFIDCKTQEGVLSHFNISVAITDKFMELLFKAGPPFNWLLQFNKKMVSLDSALSLWDKIIKRAWQNGEPGVLFIDTINRLNPVNPYQIIESTNPCGETPLGPYEACVLGSINLSKFVSSIGTDTHRIVDIEWDHLKETVQLAVRFLDNVIDVNNYPIPEIEVETKKFRKIGLGVMGWADMLIKLGISYNSPEALGLATRVMEFINTEATKYSEELLQEKDYGTWVGYGSSEVMASDRGNPIFQRRNATLTTIAPTGCSVGSSLVLTSNGIFRLDEMGNIDGERWQELKDLQVNQEEGCQTASKFFNNGVSITKKITLDNGVILESTPDHKYRCLDNGYIWKNCNELKEGDILISKIGGYSNTKEQPLSQLYSNRNIKGITLPKEMSPKLAWFVGVYLGDGSTHTKGIRLHFGAHLQKKIKEVEQTIVELFGVSPHHRKERTCTSIYLSSMLLLRWLEINGLLKDKSPNIYIPYKIRTSSTDSLRSFIEGLYFADGSKTGNTKYIDTSSYRISQELVVCLRSLGQNAYITTNKSFNGRISKKPSYRIHYKGLGSNGFNKERYVKKEYKETLSAVREYGETLFYDKVVTIASTVNPTYDIEVPITNTYVSNSMISHNTLSLIAGCSSGIEPIYSFKYTKKCLDKEIEVIHPLYQEFIEKGIYVELIPNYFVESKNIPIEQHVRMQAAFQQHTHNAVSKTINAPFETTVQEVDGAFRLAYQLGCKGLTFYRQGSREYEAQTVVDITNKLDKTVEIVDNKQEEIIISIEDLEQKGYQKRLIAKSETPDFLFGWRERVKTGDGTLWVHVFFDPVTGFREIWTNISKPGRTMAVQADVTGRTSSLALRHGATWEELEKQLKGHIGDNPIWSNGERVLSIPDATSKVIRKRCIEKDLPLVNCPFHNICQRNHELQETQCQQVIRDGSQPSLAGSTKIHGDLIYTDLEDPTAIRRKRIKDIDETRDLCPDCASPLIHDEGCKGGRCPDCGYSNCS